MAENKIITRVLASVQQLDAQTWNVLLASQSTPTPFMRHEYLAAMEQSGSATPDTGWIARVITVWDGDELLAACPLYIKTHSYGEYVFDWAWARAYQQHGLPYYPKGLLAVPFTPVPGSRLLARSQALRVALVHAVQAWAAEQQLSSLHLLFGDADDLAACAAAGWMQRSTVQFHWTNTPPALPAARATVPAEAEPASMQACADKRHRPLEGLRRFSGLAEPGKAQEDPPGATQDCEAGVSFKALQGRDIGAQDWSFFYRCYERTYLEHGNPPYLTPEFFAAMASAMPENWVMFIAERNGQPVASSLIAITALQSMNSASKPLFLRMDKRKQLSITRSPMAATGALWSGSTACISKPATTSPSNGASPTALPASKAAPRASTRWPARCCPWKHRAPTGWPTRLLPMPSSAFCSARAKAWPSM
jgi:hypothetical protein